MTTGLPEILGLSAEVTSSGSDPRHHEAFAQSIKTLDTEIRSLICDDVSEVIWLLSMIAKDEHICMKNPERVLEALQTHRELICDSEADLLRSWLVQLDQS